MIYNMLKQYNTGWIEQLYTSTQYIYSSAAQGIMVAEPCEDSVLPWGRHGLAMCTPERHPVDGWSNRHTTQPEYCRSPR